MNDVPAVRRRLDEVGYLVDEGTATAVFFALMGLLARRDLSVSVGMLRRAATLARRGA